MEGSAGTVHWMTEFDRNIRIEGAAGSPENADMLTMTSTSMPRSSTATPPVRSAIVDAPQDDAALDRARWDAVMARQDAEVAPFVYAVTTTGVYCRPSCPSRRPRRDHARFFATPALAEAAGFRACRRCRPSGVSPDAAQRAMVRRACAHIDSAEGRVSLEQLATSAGMSRFHFQRVFKRIAGMTPFEYGRARRVTRLRRELGERQSIVGSIFGAGFGSSSRVYERLDTTLGMTPGQFRQGGAGLEITWSVAPCSLGQLLVATTDRGVCAVEFGQDEAELTRRLAARFPRATLTAARPGASRVIARIASIVEQPARASRTPIPLDVQGTAFQRRVWKALEQIPAGATRSYGDVAAIVGAPAAARAVARACAANPVAVLIPCHRVVRGDGEPGGYRWGVARKRALLAREQKKEL
jgi:AraC family transcriptional regulator of adaptative response/methylated-DNA-[protein]-cysteine methyltransferase